MNWENAFGYCSLILFFFLVACAPEENSQQLTDTVASSGDPTIGQQQDPITSIKERFQVIESKLARAELRMDSTEYECAESGGRISLYRDRGELVMLRHSFYSGDHAGEEETFYLSNERPVFVQREESNWFFAGPANRAQPDQPHTQENVVEYRFYLTDFASGQAQRALRCLRKSYHLQSWVELATNPDEVPNEEIDGGSLPAEALGRFSQLVRAEPVGGC